MGGYPTIKTCSRNGIEESPLGRCRKPRRRGKVTSRFLKCSFTVIYRFFSGAWHKSYRVALKKKTGIIQSITNECFFYYSDPIYLSFPSCSSPSLCLWASSFMIRATVSEAIRGTLTQLPASLSPPPAVTWMDRRCDWKRMVMPVKYLSMPHLAHGNCSQTCTDTIKCI